MLASNHSLVVATASQTKFRNASASDKKELTSNKNLLRSAASVLVAMLLNKDYFGRAGGVRRSISTSPP
jgi:hypothetical protein